MFKTSRKNGNFYLAIAVMMMAILFYSSSQTYEQQSQLSNLSHWLKNQPFKEFLSNIHFAYAGKVISIERLGYFSFVEFFIRKAAHFTTYFILGGSLFLGLSARVKEWWIAAPFSVLAALGYAASDEFHQMLTGGRTPLFQDVMLDGAGALCAVVLIFIVKKIAKK
ncbi:VanZ family protein [Enterococcus columbae]|uniref:VanZ-like domain-containing protein n=1 Tax=Enterococcus columbae DSM 7374 = ATCC 51263 TaxID=1121865 RepID=S1MTV0_9ENTE|nr:VanZ family protein [Enterococcus columbae]EOT39578.1 hypothetical protein OMW_01878 [Enterococcus columbae DSM 7374 = ATCC 51263]EOW80105.1 hypothetical protein I568_02184 [Enterococcus columbae DSM 7374 = ATCC 51263]OJG22811.1 hypothetical protein RR47_GL000713 [Enterococcus columbae DSM 7374 = ATCC 51263]